MRIAIVGAGISGLSAAWLLSARHEVRLFEAGDELGGHTHTHRLEREDGTWEVDSGFIVFNPHNYPLFCRLLEELGVASQPSDMSFSVRNDASGLEYNATSVDTLFCQRRNLLRPRFLGMVRDILRFYREAPALLEAPGPGPSTGEYLAREGYGEAFREDHLLPMASALWSAPPRQVLEFPMAYMLRFFANHRMLQVNDRPEWRTVQGGSRRYVEALVQRLEATVHRSTPVRRVLRENGGVRLLTDSGEHRCDRVLLACHSDQALALIDRPSRSEAEVLGAMDYQRNDVVLHTDTRLLPRRRKAWAAWNARVPAAAGEACTVTYDMNILQNLTSREEFLVTLNQDEDIDPERVLARMVYHHPVYTRASVAAQQRFAEIDGVDRIHFCGAYWGWGFHEDGVRSAARVAADLGGRWDD